MRRVVHFLLLAALVACQSEHPTSNGSMALVILRTHRDAWQARAPRDYDFEFQRVCFCPDEATKPMRIEVRDGAVTGVFVIATGASVDPSSWWFPTIDEIFEQLESQMVASNYQLDVSYDATWGFPSEVSGDVPGTVDDEYWQSAKNLVRKDIR